MKYGNLPERGLSMRCENVECENYRVPWSADRGDYFWANPEAECVCGCGKPMNVGRAVDVFVPV